MTDRMIESTRMELRTSLEDVIRLFGPEGMIYSRDDDVFLRELVQNAFDAIEVRRAGRENRRGTIRVRYTDRPRPVVEVEDTGWGMDDYAVREHLAHPLRGIRRYQAATGSAPASLIGRFGVGLLSAFKVSDCIEVETCREGCDPIAFLIGIERNGTEGLRIAAFLGEGPPRPVGTKVRVHLDSADPAVSERARRIAQPTAILDALRYYVRHPGPGVEVVFRGPSGREAEIVDQPLVGSGCEPAHRFDRPGLRGAIALPAAGEASGSFQVCYRGILVKRDYPLLPEEMNGFVGEVDVLDARLADPALSREEFLDNPKLAELRCALAEEAKRFDASLAAREIECSLPEVVQEVGSRKLARDGTPPALALLARTRSGAFRSARWSTSGS